jgi:FAD/FMN-containing dehydrogenase
MSALDDRRVADLRAGFRGELLMPGGPDYDAARMVWNAMIDKRPALIARCADVQDVVRGVNFARQNGLVLAVRGGGHNIAGSALCDDGVVLDLSRMTAAQVAVGDRLVTIEAGATLADLDAATQAHGLAVPVGINSTTGVAGLTLGGGFGWLSRKHGLTVDNLDSVEMVTAAGEVIHASASEHSDLFWALRGGGGNFGVVTRFTFRLHPVGPDLLSGLVVYPLAEARSVLQQYRDFALAAPEDLTVWVVMRQAPPLPFLPAEVHGTEVVVLALLYAGDPDEGQVHVEPLRRFGRPVGEHIGVQPFAAWQQAFDPLLTPGARNYWKSHNFRTLDDKLLEVLIGAIRTLPSPQCEVFIASLGGAIARQRPDATAYGQRDARFVMNVHGRWDDPADDQRCIAWARQLFAAAAPFASGGVYVNFMTAEEGDRVRAAYGDNYDRLVRVKQQYDPGNLFRTNQNISPA